MTAPAGEISTQEALRRLAIKRAIAAIDADFREPFLAAMRLIPGGLDRHALYQLRDEFARLNTEPENGSK